MDEYLGQPAQPAGPIAGEAAYVKIRRRCVWARDPPLASLASDCQCSEIACREAARAS